MALTPFVYGRRILQSPRSRVLCNNGSMVSVTGIAERRLRYRGTVCHGFQDFVWLPLCRTLVMSPIDSLDVLPLVASNPSRRPTRIAQPRSSDFCDALFPSRHPRTRYTLRVFREHPGRLLFGSRFLLRQFAQLQARENVLQSEIAVALVMDFFRGTTLL